MSSTFEQMSRELRETFGGLSIFLAQRYVNHSLEGIYQRHAWSHLLEESVLQVPAESNTGTASVTRFSRIAQFNASADAVLSTLNNPLITSRQFRVGSGPLYSISAYDSTGDASAHPWNTGALPRAALLDRSYQEATNAASTYSIYRAYFSPPLYYDPTDRSEVVTSRLDFLRFISVKDAENWTLRIRLNSPRVELERLDPRRTSSGIALKLYTFKALADGTPLYELWPHQRAQKSYLALYQRRGRLYATDGTDDDATLPPNIPEALVMEGAALHACKWAIKNPSLAEKGVRWGDAIITHKKEFDAQLAQAIMQDKRMVDQSILIPDESEWGSPLGAEYTINHATYGHVF